MLVCAAACGQVVQTVPVQWHGGTGSPVTTWTLSAAGHRVSRTFWHPANFTLKKVHFRVPSVTTGDVLRVAVYGVDASMRPTGTPIGATTVTVSTAGYYTATFASALSLSSNTVYALVFEFDSYNGGNCTVTWGEAAAIGQYGFCGERFDGTSWAGLQCTLVAIGYEDADGQPLFRFGSVIQRGGQGFNSSSSPNERGVACTFPQPTRIVGGITMSGIYESGEANLLLYEDGVLIRSTQATRGTAAYHEPVATWFAPVMAIPGREYILSFKPQSAANAQLQWSASYGSFAAPFNALAAWVPEWASGQCRTVYRTGSGSWTETNTIMHSIGFLVEVVQ